MLPFGNGLVVAREENLRDFKAFPDAGLGVVGVFQKAILEAFLVAGFGLSHDAGEQAHHGIQKGKGRRFAAGEHEIAEGNLDELAVFDDALVDAFKTAADDEAAGACRQFADEGLA